MVRQAGWVLVSTDYSKDQAVQPGYDAPCNAEKGLFSPPKLASCFLEVPVTVHRAVNTLGSVVKATAKSHLRN